MILSDSKIKNSISSGSGVYRDEPVIRPASQMKNYTPAKIREMRKLNDGRKGRYELFAIQAKFMEDYEDETDCRSTLTLYYPTYDSLSDEQLRRYFSWRTLYRKGVPGEPPLSFVYLHIYELLCLAGASSPEDGFEKLKKIRENFPETERYMKLWLHDYAVYYDLDKSLAKEFTEPEFDAALMVLRDISSRSDDEIFDAVCALSSYNMTRSVFFSKYPSDAKTVICRVYRAISESFEKRSKKRSFFEKLFGRIAECSFRIFDSAVFYDFKKYASYEYVINDIHRYTCRCGSWSCRKYYGSRGKNSELGGIVKTADSIMRAKYGCGRPLQPGTDVRYTVKIIEDTVDRFLEEKKAAEKTKVEIDLSKLDSIRAAADVTRDRLIVDEEEEEKAAELPAAPEKPLTGLEPETPGASVLEKGEYLFLRALLYGEDFSAALRENGLLLSVAADSVNEKLFDMFGDTVIDFDGEVPVLIEDYTDELKGIIK